MEQGTVIELRVTPGGIRESEGGPVLITLEDANQLLGLHREDRIALHPYDNFTRADFPKECAKIDSVIKISKGRIQWQIAPKE